MNIALTIYIILTWFLALMLYFLPKKILFIEAAFVFMILSVLLNNLYSILGLNLRYILLTEEKDLFISLILYRSFIIPVLVLLLLNLALLFSKNRVRTIIHIAILGSLIFLELMNLKFSLIQYERWNLILQTVTFLSLFLSAYVSLYLMRFLLERWIR